MPQASGIFPDDEEEKRLRPRLTDADRNLALVELDRGPTGLVQCLKTCARNTGIRPTELQNASQSLTNEEGKPQEFWCPGTLSEKRLGFGARRSLGWLEESTFQS